MWLAATTLRTTVYRLQNNRHFNASESDDVQPGFPIRISGIDGMVDMEILRIKKGMYAKSRKWYENGGLSFVYIGEYLLHRVRRQTHKHSQQQKLAHRLALFW